MKKETIISTYLAATENILTAFNFNREPDTGSVSTITLRGHDFLTALREIYFSDNKEKDNYYKVIYEVINEANFRICKENFAPGCYSSTWSVIDHSLTMALGYISELHFKETDYHFPFPKEQQLTSQQAKATLSLRQIALLCCYEGEVITRGGVANKKASDNGHKSGDKLYQLFTFYIDRRHRIKIVEGSKIETTLKAKIELLEDVIQLLKHNTHGQKKAIDELKLLKSSSDANFSNL